MPVFIIFELLHDSVLIEDEIEMQFIGIIFGHIVVHIILLKDEPVVLKITFMVILFISLVVQNSFTSVSRS